MSRRLSTTPQLCPEAQRLEAEARAYTKIRQQEITLLATRAQIGLTPVEADEIYNIANGRSQGAFPVFQVEAKRCIEDFVHRHPDRVRYSPLQDWMNEEMNEQEKAKREIASWVDNPHIVFFDTETTGFLDEGHVPVTAAACNVTETTLLNIQMKALNEKGEIIPITEGASKTNGITDEMIVGYLPLEENEWAIRELEALMETGVILTGYNTQFDRGMICRAIGYASQRVTTFGHSAPDGETAASLAQKLNKLLMYFKQPEHWLETKDIFCRAVGEEPYPGPGKYLKLEDIAHRTKAIAPDAKQEHGALADCQLLAKIVNTIRKEIEETMPKPKSTPVAKPTEEIQTEPETELSAETKQYIETLETSLGELQARFDSQSIELEAVNAYRVKLGDRIRELENLCEQYQNGDAIKHHEAREVTWCDCDINGYLFNFTIREGETAEEATAAAFRHIKAMLMIRDQEWVKTMRVGLKDNWKNLKGFEEPSNGKTHSDDKPATPKGNQPPAANKPNMPPKPATGPAPQGNPPGNPPQGKTTGEKKSQQCDRIIRHQIDGQNTYDLPFTLNNGKPAERPFAPSKKDTGTLEKALIAAGYDVNALDIGTEYDLPILVEWTIGNQIPNSNPPKFYRDNMTFTIQTAVADEEMPF